MSYTKIQQDGLAIAAVAPQSIKSILLTDGWHDVQEGSLIQFAVAPAASPPQPNKLYPALVFKDMTATSTRKGSEIVVPLSQVLAFGAETEEPLGQSQREMAGTGSTRR